MVGFWLGRISLFVSVCNSNNFLVSISPGVRFTPSLGLGLENILKITRVSLFSQSVEDHLRRGCLHLIILVEVSLCCMRLRLELQKMLHIH